MGPLTVSKNNARYFTVASKIVYLTGSHINNNFHDGMGPGKDCAEEPEQFDYEAYLAFLKDHGHNFIRLWRWEQFRGYLSAADYHLCMTPQPWPRTGPGKAKDGKPKFDLSQFDPAYFNRLSARILTAGDKGFYVSAMLFEGFSLHLTATPDNIEGHPFHAENNINNITIHSIIDYLVLPLHPAVQALQESYIRKFIDTIQDLPNVLYEVANESSGDKADAVKMPDGSTVDTPIGDSTEWQYWVINFIKQYEEEMGYSKHPVGMTYQYPAAKGNDPLWNGPADWISPGGDQSWLTDPPANDGRKVVLSDTDHYSPMKSDALWAWKTFLRGHQPILYDLGIVAGFNSPDPSLEPARLAMGDTLQYVGKVSLAEMEPHGDLSSTGYVLADPGKEYLVLTPGETFTLMLDVGIYEVEWYNVNSRKTLKGESVKIENAGMISFSAPFDVTDPAVLYVRK